MRLETAAGLMVWLLAVILAVALSLAGWFLVGVVGAVLG